MAESKQPATEAALEQQVEELRRSNAVLQTENGMFESFLGQLDSLSLASQLTPKMEKEVAAMEDSDVRLAEIKKERHDFEEFVAGTRQTTQVLAHRAEKVIRYIKRKIKAKKALTERMRGRITFLRTETRRQQRLVHRKEQMQDTFSEIDLEHLKQKNITYRDSLQRLQEEVQWQRVLIRKSQQGLNVYKERLRKEMQESESLSRSIASQEEKLSKIREQQQKVEKERAQAEALNRKLKSQLANFRVPDVMKYVEAKATTDQLRQTVKTLERKARIAEMASRTKKCRPEELSSYSRSDD